MRKLIEKFNQPETYLIISDYPEKTLRGEKNYGIAWHTKEVIEPMARKYGVKFVVFAEKGYNNMPKLYEDDKILVLRIFDQTHHTLFPTILKWILKFNNIKKVHVHSEFFVNGGIKNFILLIPFLLLIKLTGKEITFYTHNVVSELDSIAPHLNLKKNSLTLKIMNIAMRSYYRILGFIVQTFVVMDGVLKERLAKYVSASKIFLAPFWIEPPMYTPIQDEAKKQLGYKPGEFVLLYFGFITYYKGADWVIDAFLKAKKAGYFANVKLVLAGGEAYSLKDKPYYQKYYQKQLAKVNGRQDVVITGFVPEEKIPVYFAAADLTVFPYRGLIGSSASMAHAFKYHKPFILSQAMKMVLANEDINKVIHKNNVEENDMVFTHSVDSFVKLINVCQNSTHLKKLTQVSKDIAQVRSFDTLVLACYNHLYSHNEYTRALSPHKKLAASTGV